MSEPSPIVKLREIERSFANNRVLIGHTQAALTKEAEKIGRLRQIEIDIEKRTKAGQLDAKMESRLKGTKRALALARQRFEAISERLGEYDRFGTVLLAHKNKVETALSREHGK